MGPVSPRSHLADGVADVGLELPEDLLALPSPADQGSDACLSQKTDGRPEAAF
jgi:hypothetical protein